MLQALIVAERLRRDHNDPVFAAWRPVRGASTRRNLPGMPLPSRGNSQVAGESASRELLTPFPSTLRESAPVNAARIVKLRQPQRLRPEPKRSAAPRPTRCRLTHVASEKLRIFFIQRTGQLKNKDRKLAVPLSGECGDGGPAHDV